MSGARERLVAVLALELERVIADLRALRPLLGQLWGMHRAREPLRAAIHSRWTTLRAPQLALLEPHEALALDHFYRQLEGFRVYLEGTEDMPGQLAEAYDLQLGLLAEAAVVARRVLALPEPAHAEDEPVHPLTWLPTRATRRAPPPRRLAEE